MGKKYCPKCKDVVETKVLLNYSQREYRGILAKRRLIMHKVEDGGCDHIWFTIEMPEEVDGS
jgi:hypothetical protein